MASFINIDGKLLPDTETAVLASNRGLRYGYGLFETMLVVKDAIRLEELHWTRLFSGMELLKIEHPKYFQKTLQHEVLRTISKNKLTNLCSVRLQINAGTGGLFDESLFKANYIIECFPLEEGMLQLNEMGLTIGICDIVKHADKYANLKSCSALPYALAARAAKAFRWNDALLLNDEGFLVESSIANLFWVKNGIVYTPSLESGCVAGVMRQHLLEKLPSVGFECKTCLATPDILQEADEIFLTNAIRMVRWVASLSGKNYRNKVCTSIHFVLS
ncbi:MAG: aminotransferase class IV [Chitinophagaceae bacterium]